MNQLTVTVLVILFAIFSWIKCDICDICICTKNDCEATKFSNESDCSNQIDEYFVCDGNESIIEENKQSLDFNTIQWPNKDITVSATFNNFKLTYLTNVLCSASTPSLTPTIIAVNLDSNSIRQTVSNPFEFCTNLTSISIANNLIDRLPSEFFESTLSLQRLNISHNALFEFDGGILSHCKHIIELDLSHNQITILKVNEILDASPNIETINAAGNLLFAISDNNQNKYLRLKQLNLSGNKMTVITSSTFPSHPALQNLNVSANILGNIEPNAFFKLSELRVLDLSFNQLKDLTLKLPDSVEHILLANNQLKLWPMNNLPKNLQILELQNNQLTEIFSSVAAKNRVEFSSLKFINISKNHINSLPSTLSYPVLESFDASYNEFTTVPQYLGTQAPSLKVLSLRGNPIKIIEFTTKMSAHIEVKNCELPMLTEIDAKVFNSIESGPECVELTISHNPLLRKINNTFERVPNLCRLDLSYNNFRFIDHNWMNWSTLHHGVDLQGNPIDCSCGSQWMLDYFLPMLYKNSANHHYLLELRCETPDRFKGHRLVRYLNHTDAFCNPEVAHAKFGPYQHLYSEQDDDYELLWYQGLGLWLIVSLVLIIIASSLSIVIILVRRCQMQRKIRRNNRRFNNGGIL